MLGRLTAGLTITLVFLSTISTADAGAASTSATKTTVVQKLSTKKARHSRVRQIASKSGKGSYLVPPPPPYSPSILPELAYARARGLRVKKQEEAEKPSNPYSKYVQTHNQTKEDPQPVQQGTGVVTWNKG